MNKDTQNRRVAAKYIALMGSIFAFMGLVVAARQLYRTFITKQTTYFPEPMDLVCMALMALALGCTSLARQLHPLKPPDN